MPKQKRPKDASKTQVEPVVTTVTRTEDGLWQTTTRISLQVTSTWEAPPRVSTRVSSEDGTGGGDPKPGLSGQE